MLAAFPCLAQQAIPPDPYLLAKIRVKAEENVNHLPNYTCLQTIERTHRAAPTKKFFVVDMVRLEVAFVGGKETWGWPGADKMAETDIEKLVSGTIGSGDFAIVYRNLFLTNAATFTFGGLVEWRGHQAVRFDYRVMLLDSAYHLKSPPYDEVVPFHGSFWADAETLDVLRIEMIADDIPPSIRIVAASNTLEYERVPIAGATFLLPKDSELQLTDVGGTENRNVTHFAACRQFTGESKLSFADPPPDAPATLRPASREVTIPEQLEVEIELETAIDSDASAVGDLVKAKVRGNVKEHGRILVPKGTEITGRIRVLRKVGSSYVLDINFLSLDFDGGHADLSDRSNSMMRAMVSSFTSTPGSTPEMRGFNAGPAEGRLLYPVGVRLQFISTLLKSKDR